ncbi:DNAJC7 [Cordylochernes scorpioides]|uniref:DNAJC7 n=1 Tax=Cordylochernes scorpioides TaxID=51811 RepID=A0ABY6KID9_9ARAC|nr:DNAJC7 [Cordylochernes scorpioides]
MRIHSGGFYPDKSYFCPEKSQLDSPKLVRADPILDVVFRAELEKEKGNTLYKEQKYEEALVFYNKAIEMCPECPSYYNNRAASLMMVRRYGPALQDVQQALRLDPSLARAHIREAKIHIALGDPSAAHHSLQKVAALEPSNSALATEIKQLENLEYYLKEAQRTFGKRAYREFKKLHWTKSLRILESFRKLQLYLTIDFFLQEKGCVSNIPTMVFQALYYFETALKQAVASDRLKLLKAECHVYLKQYQEANEITGDILRQQQPTINADALYVRGLTLYYQDNMDKALSHFLQVLKLAPDHQKACLIYRRAKLLKTKKDEGNNAFKNGNLQEAYDLYSAALDIDPSNEPINAKLYFNRATVCSKLKKPLQAVGDCTSAISLDESYLKAYARRGKSYLDLEMYEEAVRDYEILFKKERNKANKALLDQAKLELRKSKRKDYYKILGVSKTASDDEIKKAYKKLALLHHPDRHSDATPEAKSEQEKKFKELGEAYAILSDPKKKHRYDNSVDDDDNDHMGCKSPACDGSQHDVTDDLCDAAAYDPNHIFQAFFNATGGPEFVFDGGRSHGQGFHFQFH